MPLSFRLILAAALSALIAAPVTAKDKIDPGAYLAARIAGANNDYREAANWFTRALVADPSDPLLMEGAVVAHISTGNFEAAVAVARRMLLGNRNTQPQLLALIADQAKRGDYAGMLADAKAGRSVGSLLDGMLAAWAQLGAGQMSIALEEFDKLAKTPGLEAFGLYHKGLALASVGDFEGADRILGGKDNGPINLMRRGIIAHVQILSQLERNADAVALLERAFPNEADPAVADLLRRLNADETIPFDTARNVTDGMAEVFFTLAVALNGDAQDAFTLLHSRVATYLRPDHSEALLLTGALLENQKQYDLAIEAYSEVARTDGGFYAAEIGRARALQEAGKPDAGLEVLTALTQTFPDLLAVHLALADALRREERWADAVPVYDKAVSLIDAPNRAYWSVYYSRAVALERSKQWEKAEADFRKSLELDPDQPQVLNYLGYSYLERNENLEEALAMIERAVKARPDSGYIVDSLAWGLFRLGRYAEAVEPMERASLLEPVDPVVTDHLGDVYWAVGRKLEARFQWHRALSFDPEEKDAIRIRRKLEIGLDAVLAEEGAKPLAEVANGN